MTLTMKGTLYLIPVTLGGDDIRDVIPTGVLDITMSLRYFIVEELRSARRFLRSADPGFPIDDSVFSILNEHTRNDEISQLLAIVADGTDAGLMSEAGLPGIADPGALVVAMAHRMGIKVKPLSGPSSVILALISSGMNGQSFTFNGYLPVKPHERMARIKELEARSMRGETQIFMETPYRNTKLLTDILNSCRDTTKLCIAAGISTSDEMILTMTIAEWRSKTPQIDRIPAIFVLQT